MTPQEKSAKRAAAKAAAGPALFAPGDRVIWHAKHNGKDYPATVRSAGWFPRTAEPWQYQIELDATPQTARMSWSGHYRFPPQSQLTAAPDAGPANPASPLTEGTDQS
jgi:hypothetical protein